ncbi:MAG: hypothetical protein KBH45_09445, partial [Verrucomicrobia bacterium]|nr:hypothetical protein [Verrucomicrobiota bacterium]
MITKKTYLMPEHARQGRTLAGHRACCARPTPDSRPSPLAALGMLFLCVVLLVPGCATQPQSTVANPPSSNKSAHEPRPSAFDPGLPLSSTT